MTPTTHPLTEMAVRRVLAKVAEATPMPDTPSLELVQQFTQATGSSGWIEVPGLFPDGWLCWNELAGWMVEPLEACPESFELLNCALRHSHPFPVGARVYYSGQRWQDAMMLGTANVLAVRSAARRHVRVPGPP